MKKILYLAFVLVGTSVSAQYWVAPFINANENPGALNTDVEQTAAFMVDLGWTTIMSPSTATPTWSAAQTIPFAFEFNGVAETQFVVSSSGVLTFDVAGAGAAPSSTRGTLPSASLPDKSVAVWGINCAGGNDGITVKTFGTAPNRQMYIMFASVGYGDAASPGGNWAYWSIVLEETTNAIYIADQRTNGFAGINTVSMGVQVDASTAILYNGTSDYTNQAGEDDSPANNTYFAFFPGSQPQFDMSVSEITTPTYVGLGNTNIDGTIKNMGSETITSMTLNYKIDGGAVVSQNVTGLSISSLGSYSFSHGTPWNAVAGAHTVEAYATNLNGANADENTGNDIGTKTINVLEELIQRMPLLEVFTSSTCAPCTPGNANFHSIMDAKPKTDYVAIKFQQNFPGVGDPYHTTEALDRRNTPYAINSIPRMEIDGGWDGNANSYTEQLYLDARAQPAFYKLEGEYKIYEQSFDINVRFSPAVDVSGERLYIALIEDRTDNNIGNNGETEFFDVMKKMVPNVAGTALPNTAIGAWDSLSFNYKFKGDYRLPANGQPANIINHAIEHSVEDFNNVQAIAWVQGTDKTVFQAARLNFVAGTAGTFETAAKMTGVSVSPNPANESMKVEFNTVESEKMTFVVVDMMGNKVQSFVSQSNVGANAVEVNTSKLSTGVYHLMVFDSKNSAHIEKIAVQH